MQTILFALGLVVCAVVVSAAEQANYARPELLIEGTDLAKAASAKQLVILDARSRSDYEAEQVPGAVWVDEADWRTGFNDGKDAGAWSQRISAVGIRPGSQVVIYDAKDSIDAARIWWILRFWGVSDVRLLNGGWQAWKAAGLPTTPGRFEAKAQAARLDTKQQIMDVLNKNPRQIVDARSQGEFCGIDKKDNQRGGAIPGSKNLDWNNLIDKQTHRFKPPQEIRRLLAEAGIELNRPTTTYCQSGGRASVMAFALELMGAHDVRNYYRSWKEWGNAGDTPIATPPQPAKTQEAPKT
jgi:thiosulfate/3-mercaptopyruvate sulfurtransferase